jgi:hypothetical protein
MAEQLHRLHRESGIACLVAPLQSESEFVLTRQTQPSSLPPDPRVADHRVELDEVQIRLTA